MSDQIPSLEVESLGQCTIPSPLAHYQFVSDDDRILLTNSLEEVRAAIRDGGIPPSFERAGPREQIFFSPAGLRAGIVTCGGLCPGLNDVIRAITLSLHHHYGVRHIYGFLYGFEGLVARYRHEPLKLTPETTEGIRGQGGTILKSSRGPQEVKEMVDTLDRLDIRILFVLGGDGTLRGGQAIREEIRARGLKIAVVGVPKTIDNDISYVQRSFGFQSAVAEARRAVAAAHVEAEGAKNGVGLVKLMGRESGFIACHATLASGEVNFCLIPESKFTIQRLLVELEARLASRGHAVIVAAEGAGQDIMGATGEKDPSGNLRLGDIGMTLRDEIKAHFKKLKIEVNLKYIDPSYIIRSLPANPSDGAFCLSLGQSAVHAAMAGKTNVVVGLWNNKFTHVPIAAAVSERQKVDLEDWLWNSVLAATGQPRELV